jgi:hypothetical protein
MDMNTILSYGSAAAVALLGVLGSESAKEVIKKFFSGLSRRQINFLFYSLLTIAAFGTYYAVNITTNQKATMPAAEVPKEEKPVKEKSEAEVYVEAGLEAIDIARDEIHKKHVRDSVKITGRDKMWVYQLGLPMSSEKELWQAYKELKGISGITVFKQSRKSYILVKDDGADTEEEVKNGLEAIRQQADSLGIRVKVIDLWTFCSKREILKKGDRITDTKESIPCYICDK